MENLTSNKSTSLTLASIVCGLAALFYLYEFILQVSPGVMTAALMREFHIDAAGLGVMSSFYFYAYCFMQIPAGFMFDSYGPRRLLTMAIIMCAAGAVFFATTDSFAMAAAGRFSMGFGSAFSYIGVLVLLTRWFPPYYFAMLAGVAQMMSSIGSMLGEAPLAEAAAHYGWRSSMNALALIGVVLAIFVWLIVRDHPDSTITDLEKSEAGGIRTKLATICKNSQTWWVYLYTLCIWGPITAFAALWGVPYLQKLYSVSATVAGAAVSMVWLGIGLGSPLIGWWSDKIKRRCLPLALSAFVGLLSTSCIFFLSDLSLSVMYVLLFCFGLASSGQSLAFGVVKDNNEIDVVGTAMGFNNMAPIMGGAICQPLAGILLQQNWDGTIINGVPVYSISNYQISMMIIPILYGISFIVSAFILRETKCQGRGLV